MSDYIQDEKSRLEQEAGREELKEQIRLHKAAVIRAKVPDFWNVVIQKLKADCERCAATFPNNGQRNPILTEKENGFQLRNTGFPARVFDAVLRVEGLFVKVLRRGQSDQYSPIQDAGQEDIRIEVDSSEDIRLVTSQWELFQTPEDVAQYFISAVCQFKRFV